MHVNVTTCLLAAAAITIVGMQEWLLASISYIHVPQMAHELLKVARH